MKQNLVHLGLGLVACLLFGGCVMVMERRVTPQHIYTIDPKPAFLTEELAVEKARETLARDGYRLEEWQVTHADTPRGKAPDGKRDVYFERFSFRPHAGRVYFRNKTQVRTYSVWLDGDRLTCTHFRGL